jgi:hypothetical protein
MIMRFSVPIASVSRKIQTTRAIGLSLIRLILLVVLSAVTCRLAFSLVGLITRTRNGNFQDQEFT